MTHEPLFYATLGLLLAVSAVYLVHSWWTWNDPDARLQRDWRRARRPW